MMNCQQATKLLSDAQEKKLTLNEKTSVKIHVMMCSGCRNFGLQMDDLRGLTRRYAKTDMADLSKFAESSESNVEDDH